MAPGRPSVRTALVNHWNWLLPLLAWLAFLAKGMLPAPLLGAALVGTILAGVYHAEVIAHRLGEPFGTLILAVAVTIIEVGLIVTLMLASPADSAALARNTVFAAVMIILGGLVGACLLIGGLRHGEQEYRQSGVSATLACLTALTILTLVLPNFTVSAPGPIYSPAQLGFVAVVSFLLYATFVAVQTIRHRSYFLPKTSRTVEEVEEDHGPLPSDRTALVSGGFLLISLAAVVLLAKSLAPALEEAVRAAGAPHAVVGVLIAMLVLLPESISAIRAARRDQLQTSLNLALGSAMATIGLTIPVVSALSLMLGLPVTLGLESKESVLLFLSLIVSTNSLATGRTTILQGAVHLTIFAVYLFLTLVP